MKSNIVSPLSYPGGKRLAQKHILPLIPYNEMEICSPFLGGGSLEISWSLKGKKVYGYDNDEKLINFWKHLLSQQKELADEIERIVLTETTYEDTLFGRNRVSSSRPVIQKEILALAKKLREEYGKETCDFKKAAMYWVINKISWNGSTFGKGASARSGSKGFFRKEVIHDYIRKFKVGKLSVEQMDFNKSIPLNPESFLYVDPPYIIDDDNLYGTNGDLHKNFDHQSLFDLLSKRDKWLLSYNDCPQIREMYKEYSINTLSWIYQKRDKDKTEKTGLIRLLTAVELLICSKDQEERINHILDKNGQGSLI